MRQEYTQDGNVNIFDGWGDALNFLRRGYNAVKRRVLPDESPKVDSNARNLDAVRQHKRANKVKGTSWYLDPNRNKGYRLDGADIAEEFEITSGLNTGSDGYTDLAKDAKGKPLYTNDGNLRSTGAGVFTLSRRYNGYGEPMYFMTEGRGNTRGYQYPGNKNRTGRQTNQAFHAPASPSRAVLIGDGNDANNKVSFGCVSPSQGMLDYWTQKGIISPGDTVYVEPTVEGDYLQYNPSVGRIVTHYDKTPSTVEGKNYGVKYKLNNVRYNKGF